jgi:cysteine synthase A
MGRKYANILETVGNTPVIRINKLAPEGINLFVKMEAFNPLGSVKDRLALGVIEDAERSGALQPGQTVVEATSGNTGIGLAMVCAQGGIFQRGTAQADAVPWSKGHHHARIGARCGHGGQDRGAG